MRMCTVQVANEKGRGEAKERIITAGESKGFLSLVERREIIRQADRRAQIRIATQNFEGLTL